MARSPCLLNLAAYGDQVDSCCSLGGPDAVIVHERVTNGSDLGTLHRSACRFLVEPGGRYHRCRTKHHSVAQQLSTVRGSIPLVEQAKCLGQGVLQVTDYATQRWPRAALAPLPAAELRPRKD